MYTHTYILFFFCLIQITRLYSYPEIVKISYVNYVIKKNVVSMTTSEDEIVTTPSKGQDQSLF